MALLGAACARSSVAPFIKATASILALTHVRLIDGSGSPGVDDQTILLRDGRIAAVGGSSRIRIPSDAQQLDMSGHTVFPGLAGMHDHLFYTIQSGSELSVVPAQAVFAKLYLASGVTTIRTAGAVDFDGDLRIKQRIDAGKEPGPKIHITSPYLYGGNGDPDRIAAQIAEWADRGATTVKAYTSLRGSELKAAIQAAHSRGIRITGHLCAVGFGEAAALGIDNLEHGLPYDTEFYSAKQEDACPDQNAVASELVYMDVGDARVREMIWELVRHGVAVTSTLAIIESFTTRESAIDARIPTLLSSRLREQFTAARAGRFGPNNRSASLWATILRKEMEFERAFVGAGGRLIAGADPTGWGGVVAGFGDQRQLELLVEAGFSPEMALKIASANGAAFLRESQRIGTVAVGKQADLVIVRGNPSSRISDVRNVELVFKDGVAYDSEKLIASAEGAVGRLDVGEIVRRPIVASLLGLILAVTAWIVRSRLRKGPV